MAMIPRRILRIQTTALQLLRPYSRLLEYKPSSSFLPGSSGLLVRHFSFNNRSKANRSWFSSQALADQPTGGIVDVPLAQTGEGIAECELLKWFVKEGDDIEEFQPLCEVQSDKASIEITSRYKGKVAQVSHVPGDIVKVGETLLKLLVGEFQLPVVTCNNAEKETSTISERVRGKGAKVLSTPAVRNLAKQRGIDINDVQGTGIDGRVSEDDVLRYASARGIINDSSCTMASHPEELILGRDSSQQYTIPEDKTVPLRGFHRTMVKTMTMAAKVPHFHFVEEINCDALVELKASLRDNNTDPDIKHTFLPFLIKSLSMALTKHPPVNSCFNEESVELILKGSHNIGVAMAAPNGLVVPNIKNVQSLSLLEITKDLSRLQQLAKSNKLSPEDVTGGTITLSNIGAIGGKFGSPIVSLPEVAIIALGRIQKVPRFSDDGTIYPACIMTVNVGADHRVLDGATVARFCCDWKQFIEKPELMMLQMR